MLRKKNTLLTLLIVTCCFLAPAQTKKEKKLVKKYVEEAQAYFDEEDYFNAWQKYKLALALDKKNGSASVNSVICSFKLNYPVDSVAPLAAILVDSKLVDAKFYLAKIRHQQRSFDEAIRLLEDYNHANSRDRINNDEETTHMIEVCKNAKSFISRAHRSIIKNMGPEVNSAYPDYVPVIMPDESAIFFTSRRKGSSYDVKDVYNNYCEDVYVSYRENGQWKKAENVGLPINSETNDACVAISPDGLRMIVYRTSPNESSGDLYITRLGNDNIWGPLQKMGTAVNSQYIETSACFSNDTSEIYFSSNRPGGYGGKDIYRVKKLPTGSWAMPFNLGPAINTTRDDDAPFLHPDGVTLYYSSQGHNTMGEFDVFKSVLNLESNQFSESENLGYPINDVGNDIFFVLSVDGQRGYYSSIRQETFGSNDIYQIDTRFGDNDLAVKPGKAFIDNVPGKVKITLIDNENNQVNGNYYSNSNTGKFILVMNPLKSYRAIIETEGYEALTVDLKPMALDRTEQELEFKLDKK